MLTLEKCLSQTHKLTPFEAGIRRLCDCSLLATRLLSKDAMLLRDLLQNHQQNYTIDMMQEFLKDALISDELTLKKTLRQLRQLVLLRVMYRDLNNLCDLQEVMQTTTFLAEISLQTSAFYHQEWLEFIFGQPKSEDNEPQQLIIVGMGKLGGGELNVSSDVDLIFSYEQTGETAGVADLITNSFINKISNQDFFNKLGKKVIAALDDVTEDGFVFRMDMRLRPFGSEGILVPNCDALEEYYQNNGREWERYAWIKGRVLVGPQALISKLLKPFVFRKYLDFNAFASMRDLKLQIHRDVQKKGLLDNIKLGRGGIREIEFIAQVFQLIRGGTDTSLQIKPTLTVLNLLQIKGLLPANVVNELIAAYVFLRNLEHRLMYVDDQQVQDLPKTDEAKARIASAMEFDNWQSFLIKLNVHRQVVQTHFDATFAAPVKFSQANTEPLWQGMLSNENALQALQEAGYSDTESAHQHLLQLRASTRYLQLPEASRLRFDSLIPLVITQAGLEINSNIVLLRMINLLEGICRRASYLALLAQYPKALHLVIKLCAASPWLSQYLTAHPILLDELLDSQNLYATPNFGELQMQLSQQMQLLNGDVEAQMDAMRHFKHAAIMRFAAQDLDNKLSLETLSDYLSALADVILQISVQTIWQEFKYKHCSVPKFAIIGYGKLGSKELGYGSDLDIIFIYDDENEGASEIYARFAQRISNWFNSITNAGLLYETDLQLRPDGNSGLLVSSLSAFKEYQMNKAWVWEYQALSRARFVAGDANIGNEFEQVRINVLNKQRDVKSLKKSVLEMREKMRASHKPKVNSADTNLNDMALFDIKHGVGGIIDVEFALQFLILAHANQYPQLTRNIGNIALLNLMATLKIIDSTLSVQVESAYREYRRLQHALKLQGATQMTVEFELVSDHALTVTTFWQQILLN